MALLAQQCWIRLYFVRLISQHQAVARDLRSSSRNAIWVPDAMDIKTVAFNASCISLRFALDLSDIRLLDRDLSDTDLNLLETDIDSFPVNILLASKKSGRLLQGIS